MKDKIKIREYVRTKTGRIAILNKAIEKSRWCEIKDKTYMKLQHIQ